LEFPSTALKGTQRLLVDEVPRCNTDSEASHLAWKCGTRKSDSAIWTS
jgi:hypothetical protein